MEIEEIPSEFRETLTSILPDSYDTKILSFEYYPNDNSKGTGFTVVLRLAVFTGEEAVRWLKKYELKSFVSHRVARTHTGNSQKLVFKKEYHCVHSTRRRSDNAVTPHPKRFGCTAKTTITVKRISMKKSKDIHLKTHPCEISLRHTHNHPLTYKVILQNRKPTTEVVNEFSDLYKEGYSPSQAFDIYNSKLKIKYGKAYNDIIEDRGIFPKKKWCYDLYHTLFKTGGKIPVKEEIVASLEKQIDEYNENCRQMCAVLSKKDNLIFAICSPMMKQAHKLLESSCEVLYINICTVEYWRRNWPYVDINSLEHQPQNCVLFLMCPTMIGGLPVGIVVTYNDSEEAITAGLKLFKTVLPVHAFFDRKQPSLIVIDDKPELQQSCLKCFDSAKVMLCKFHLQRMVLHKLWKDRTNCNKWITIYKEFKNLLRCKNDKEFVNEMNKFLSNKNLKECDLQDYFDGLNQTSKDWAPCYAPFSYENDTNGMEFRALKNKITEKKGPSNIIQAFIHIVHYFDAYFRKKLTSIIEDEWEGPKIYNKYRSLNFECSKLSDDLYKVRHKGKEVCLVNHRLAMCTCCDTVTPRTPCQHLHAVVKAFHLDVQDCPNVDDPSKLLLGLLIKENEHPESFIIRASGEKQRPLKTFSENEKVTAASIKLQECFRTLDKNLRAKPEIYLESVSSFVKNFEFCNVVESSLVSALESFGTGKKVELKRKISAEERLPNKLRKKCI